jgi:ATP-binding cassette subfamily C exporter for protease/lipase
VATWPQFLASKTAFEHLRGLLSLGALDLRIPLSQTPTGRVTVKNLTVRVPLSGKELLQAVDFEVPPGTVTVVLGPSGSGKTTLARSLLGIGPEFVGEVLLDDQPIQQWTRDSLGRYLGYLPQDIDLFSGTVAENIARLGSVDSAKVIEAAQAAGIHQMILRLPNGYETQLGPGGSFLSGGQRQRIGLARALYGDPVVLILDEPNSNLDQEAETALLRVMDELRRKGKTIVMVSHRPGVIQVADRLIILQNGRLLAEGPRDHVLAALQKRRGFSPEAAELSGT